MIRTDCPRCLTEYRFREGLANSFVRCPRCKEKFRVADPSQSVPSEVQEPVSDRHQVNSDQTSGLSASPQASGQKRRTACPHCRTQYKFKPENNGREYQCKQCGRYFEMRENLPSRNAPTPAANHPAREEPHRPVAPPETKKFGKLPFMQLDDGPDVIELGEDDIVDRKTSFDQDALDLDTAPAISPKRPTSRTRTGPRRTKSGGMPTSYLGRPARGRRGAPPPTSFHYYMGALFFGFLAITTAFVVYQADFPGKIRKQAELRKQERERQRQQRQLMPFMELKKIAPNAGF